MSWVMSHNSHAKAQRLPKSACTVCVLPSLQIGHHFSKWGRVMDVVMVKDFGPLLNLASTATTLEQNRKAAETKLAHGRKAGASPGNAASHQQQRCQQCMLPHGLMAVQCASATDTTCELCA